MRRCAKICDFRIYGINSAYAILKTELYVEEYAICGFATYAIACAIVCSHITGIPITVQVYSVHCWPQKYSMSRF